jgi:hypothetical protein
VKLHVETYDRHGEHVDPEVPLCEHGDLNFYPGDTFKFNMMLGNEIVGQFEMEYPKKGELRVVMNHLDYLIAKAKRS